MAFLDKTFCRSPNCNNECGRKMTEEEQAALLVWAALLNPDNDPDVIVPVSYAYFCGIPDQEDLSESRY